MRSLDDARLSASGPKLSQAREVFKSPRITTEKIVSGPLDKRNCVAGAKTSESSRFLLNIILTTSAFPEAGLINSKPRKEEKKLLGPLFLDQH